MLRRYCARQQQLHYLNIATMHDARHLQIKQAFCFAEAPLLRRRRFGALSRAPCHVKASRSAFRGTCLVPPRAGRRVRRRGRCHTPAYHW